MDCRSSIRTVLAQSDGIVQRYLQDLNDKDLFARPCDQTNHIAWQLGHLIKAERHLVEQVSPGSMRPLPDGFVERHAKECCSSNDPAKFYTKDQYLSAMKSVREDTLKVVDKLSDTQFDAAVKNVPPFVKTAGETLLFIGGHWLMHAGQWAVTRRSIGKPPLF
jgi:hypothetical protein